MKITIISIFRDSEATIQNCLKQLDELEKNTDAPFEYFFYENDSKDKTKKILSELRRMHYPEVEDWATDY